MKSIRRRTYASLLKVSLVAVVLGAAPLAMAIPKVGDAAPNARIEDADEHGLELKTLKGKPFVLIYDDKDSSPTSAGLRRDLLALAKSDAYKSKVVILPVAYVAPYNLWPAKGVVKDAVREESRKQGTTVYCDWTGELRSSYNLRGGVSQVVLVGKDGRVAFASEGVPTGAELKRLLDLLRADI